VAAVLNDPGDPTGGVVEEGSPAPDFTLMSDSGEAVTLSSFRGAPVVLYFYPRDDSPGCTKQACGIRDSYDAFEERDVVVLGVSTDDESSHLKFKQKHDLPFTLLADPDHEVSEQYGVWGERKFAGKTYMGIERSTFLIDPAGRVTKVMRRVKPATHAELVLAALPA
jgi:peroxiredoxin Q/BCP